MELLGGVWYRDAPCLEGLVFDDLGYYPTHFNDFPSAMVTTWALLMVNNYWVYMDAAYNCIAHVQWWQATHPTPSPSPTLTLTRPLTPTRRVITCRRLAPARSPPPARALPPSPPPARAPPPSPSRSPCR